MKRTVYNKLIRDNIPKIIVASGKECDVRILSDEEYIIKLKEKMIEEANEVLTADEKEIIAELADVLEIVEVIEKYYKIDHGIVEEKMRAKAVSNGKFEKKLLLIETRQ